MANSRFTNVKISGISACVPKDVEKNHDLPYGEEVNQKIITTTGVEERRVAKADVSASDLCYEAALKLFNDLGEDLSDIDLLIFNSQTPDYLLPNTSAILQEKFGMKKTTICFDMNLGCSGYIYSLFVAFSIVQSTGFKKALILTGDTLTHKISPNDRSTRPLFGDAGSATLIEYFENSESLWDLNTDGSGSEAIIIPAGGARNPVTVDSLVEKDYDSGVVRKDIDISLNGMEVFNFSISTVPKSIKAFIENFNIDKDSVDFFVFHQANLMMNNLIAQKLKLQPGQMPLSLRNFGNTSCASIPLTIVTELKEKIESGNSKLVLSGFGVGLSYGSCLIDFKDVKISDLVEYDK